MCILFSPKSLLMILYYFVKEYPLLSKENLEILMKLNLFLSVLTGYLNY